MNNFTNEQHMSVKVCFLFLFDLLSLLRSYKLLTCQPAKTITSYMAKLTATVHIYIYSIDEVRVRIQQIFPIMLYKLTRFSFLLNLPPSSRFSADVHL